MVLSCLVSQGLHLGVPPLAPCGAPCGAPYGPQRGGGWVHRHYRHRPVSPSLTFFSAYSAGDLQPSSEPQLPAASLARGALSAPGAPLPLQVLLQPFLEALGGAAASLPQEQGALRERQTAHQRARARPPCCCCRGRGRRGATKTMCGIQGTARPVSWTPLPPSSPTWPAPSTGTGTGIGTGSGSGVQAGAGRLREGGVARRAAVAAVVINEDPVGGLGARRVRVGVAAFLSHGPTGFCLERRQRGGRRGGKGPANGLLGLRGVLRCSVGFCAPGRGRQCSVGSRGTGLGALG